MNLGSEKAQLAEKGTFVGRERMETMGRIWEKHPYPKASGEKVEKWKQPQGLN